MDFLHSDLYTYLVLPVLIVIARITDVSMGTIKIILISRGIRNLAALLGFFEVLVWLLAVTRIFQNLDNWVCYIAYAIGFALGSLVGMRLDERLAIGVELIRIITRKDAAELINALRSQGYSVTVVPAEGSQGKVGILYSIINRKNLKNFVATIKQYNPKAFYTIESIRFVSQLPGTVKSKYSVKNK